MADDSGDKDDAKKPKEKRSKRRAAGDADAAPPPPSPAATAGMASCLTGLILLLLVVGTMIFVWFNPWYMQRSWSIWDYLVVVLLLIAIPIVVYRAVTLWIMGEGPRFVDIEFSWRAGMEAMAEQGISLKSAPLFVIVGGGSHTLRKNLMVAAGTEFRVNGVPDVPAPLHWYASDDAIYLFLDDVTWTNLAARQYRSASRSRRAGRGPSDEPREPGGRGRMPIISTLVPGAPSAADHGAATMPPGADLPSDAGNPSMMGAEPSTPRPSPRAAYLGTLSPEHVQQAEADPRLGAKPAGVAPRRAGRVASGESALQLRRMEAVCAKLRRYRQPVCPLNGILVLLPFDMLQASRPDIEEIERALSADLETAQRELQVRCPVTALVVAMEQEKGFCELIRRIGREHAARQRFGRRFDIRREPTVEELQRFSTHVCGAFEDWVYTLFREDRVLSHPGNPALYSLLCKVRRSFQARLSDVLSKGFGYDPQVEYDPLLFSGCYFAATGAQPDRQAFVSGVLSKLREEQEDLEWTDDALGADTRRRRTAIVGWGVAGVLAALLATLVFGRNLWR